jgi:mutator protein MutT
MEYQYCLKCGGELEITHDGAYVCTGCGFHLYVNPRASTAMIIENDKNEILLVKRKFPPKQGYWDLPGGIINLGESAEESVQRELKEELNTDVKDFKYFRSYPEQYKYKGDTIHMLPLIFTSRVKSMNITVGDDVSDYKFFKKENIPFKDLAFPVIKQALQDYLSSSPQSE